MKRTLFILMALLLAAGVEASEKGASGGSVPSLKLLKGAQTAGMAGANLALVNNAEALFSNPAGMSQLRRPQLLAVHDKWIADINQETIAFAMPWYGKGAWGFGASYLYTDLQGRDEAGNLTSDFQAFDFTGHLGLSLDVTRWLSVGAAYKVIRQSLGDVFSMGSAFDLGVQITKLADRRLNIALAANHLGTPVSLGDHIEALPREFKAGMSLALIKSHWFVTADYGYQSRSYFNTWRFGTAYSRFFGELEAAVRAGYEVSPRNEAGGLSGMGTGFGLGIYGFQVDYAYQPVGDLGDSHKIGLTYTFD